MCAGVGGAHAGEGPLALAKESAQCLNGLPCRQHRGHLTHQTQIKMTRDGSLLRPPCAVLGLLHLCGFPKYPKYLFAVRLTAFFSTAFQLEAVRDGPEDSGPISEIKGRPPARVIQDFLWCSEVRAAHHSHRGAVDALKVLCNLFKIIHLSQIKGPLTAPPAGLC